MAGKQPPGPGRIFKNAIADAHKVEKLRRTSRARSGVEYPALFSAAMRQAAGIRAATQRGAVLNLRRRAQPPPPPKNHLVHGAGDSDTPTGGEDSKSRSFENRLVLVHGDTPTGGDDPKNGSGGEDPRNGSFEEVLAPPARETQDDSAGGGGRPIRASTHQAAALKLRRRDARGIGAPSAEEQACVAAAKNHDTVSAGDSDTPPMPTGDDLKNRSFEEVLAPPARGTQDDYAGGGGRPIRASTHRAALCRRDAGAVGDAAALPKASHTVDAEKDDEAEQTAKNRACVDDFMRGLARQYGLRLPSGYSPPLSPPPPPPPLELREATPPPPAFPPPPIVRIQTVCNSYDARLAFQAWTRRGSDALLVDIPEDVPAAELELIWEVLSVASLNVFYDPVSIARRLSMSR